MPKGENITTSIYVDISEFKANIKEANRLVKQSQAEFTSIAKAMDNWGESTDGVTAKIKSQYEQLDLQRTIQTNLINQIEDMIRVIENEAENIDKLHDAMKDVPKGSDEYEKYQKELDKVEQKLKRDKAAVENLTTALIQNQGKINELGKDLKNYNYDLIDYSDNNDEGTTATKKLGSEIEKNLNKNISKAEAEFKLATAGMDDWKKETEGLKAELEYLDKTLEAQKGILSVYDKQLANVEQASDEYGAKVQDLEEHLKNLKDNGVSETSEEFKKYQGQLEATKSYQSDLQSTAEDLKIKILNQKAAIEETNKKIGNYSSSLKDLEAEQSKSSGATEKLTDTIDEQKDKLKDLKDKYQDVVLEQGKDSDSAKSLASEIDKLSGELKENQEKLEDAEESADSFDHTLDDLNDNAKDTEDGFTVMKGALANLVSDGIEWAIDKIGDLIRSIGDLAGDMIAFGIDYESAFAGVAKTLNGTDEELAQVNDDIREMATRLPQSADEIANVAAMSAQLGIGAEDIGKFTEQMIMLGDATNVSSEDAAVSIAQLYNVMGGDLSTVDQFAAALTQLGNNSATTEADILAMASRLASAGQQMGLSEQEVLALSTTMSSVGLHAEMGGSAISQIMLSIDKEVATSGKNLETWANVAGMSVDDFASAWKNDAMGALQAVIGGMGEAGAGGENLNLILDDLGISAIRQTDTMRRLSSASEQLNEYVDMSNSAWDENNALLQESERRYGTTESKLEIMKNNFKEIGLTIFDEMQPALQKVIDKLIEFTPAIEDMFEGIDWEKVGSLIEDAFDGAVSAFTWIVENKDTLIAGLAGIAAGFVAFEVGSVIMTVVEAIKAFKLANEGATLAQLALNAAMSINPVALVAIAVAALVAGIVLLIQNWDKVKAAGVACWDAIKAAWDAASGWFDTNVIEPVKTFFSAMWEDITGFFSAAWDKIVDIFTPVAKWFDENVITPLEKFFSPIVNFLSNTFKSAWDKIVNIWKAAAGWFNTNVVKPIENFFSPLIEFFSSMFQTVWENMKTVWNDIVIIFKWAWDKLVEYFTPAVDWFEEKFETVKSKIETIWNAIVEFLSDIWNSITDVFKDVATWFGDKFTTAWDNITTAWNSVTTFFSGVWNDITGVFNNTVSWFQTKFNDAWTKIKEVFNPVGEFFEGIWDTIKEKFTDIGQKVGDSIGEVFKTAINAVLAAAETVLNAPINAINSLIDNLKNVPGLGNLGKLSTFDLPRLERGGVLRKGEVGLLEGNGAEAVVPLERNKHWIKAVAGQMKRELSESIKAQGIGDYLSNQSNVNNFTQIINAPKQPSRIELYRQTKNLLSLRGVNYV